MKTCIFGPAPSRMMYRDKITHENVDLCSKTEQPYYIKNYHVRFSTQV